jgi:outer membrane lipoprotein-sorting protein
MKQILYVFISLFVSSASISAQNADIILDKAAEAYTNSNGITATFAMRTHLKQQDVTESFEGKINIKGDKFTLATPDLRTWYDGTTQWTYMERSEEVNITSPVGDELQLTNPAILLKSYKKGFNASCRGESTAFNGKATYDIELTPKKKNNITKIALQIEKFSSLPASISVEMKNGTNNVIHISELKKDVNQPDSFFVFNEADYPGAEIIDLR